MLSANPQTVAEPSGAVAPAAFLFHASELPATRINVAVISGGNINPTLLAELRQEKIAGCQILGKTKKKRDNTAADFPETVN